MIGVQLKQVIKSLLWNLRRRLRKAGFDVTIFDKQSADFQLAALVQRNQIECMLDVGANRGQFARYMRLQGFEGMIHSFEPLPAAFHELAASASRDRKWQAHNLALSGANRIAKLNIGVNDQTSSLSGTTPSQGTHLVKFDGSIDVQCHRLDELLASERLATVRPEHTLLKLDVQGCEMEVLEGLGDILARFPALFIETSLVKIYNSDTDFSDLSRFLAQYGFSAISFKGGLHHPDHGYLMQIDVLFERCTSKTAAKIEARERDNNETGLVRP